ncbi:hypothetical protein PZA11_005428 [Diplocarpon coronariae]
MFLQAGRGSARESWSMLTAVRQSFVRQESKVRRSPRDAPGRWKEGESERVLTGNSYNVAVEELFDLFGKFGPIRYVKRAFKHTILINSRQIRQGIANNTKGTAFVVYEDVMDAKQACDKLNGFNFQNRYLVVLYHQPDKMVRSKEDLEARKENLEQLKKQHGIE